MKLFSVHGAEVMESWPAELDLIRHYRSLINVWVNVFNQINSIQFIGLSEVEFQIKTIEKYIFPLFVLQRDSP